MSTPVLGHRFFYPKSYRFRWVYCQLEVLQHCFPSTVLQTLDQLPESLDDTYAHVLSQIPQVNRANAHRMLQCLMVAVRPLRVEELAELLAFEFGKAQGVVPKYRADWRPNDGVDAVLSTCSSLIAIVDDQGSQVVQFSHFSVKEFLMSDRLTSSLGDFSRYHILPGPAHTILAQACLGFLLHLDDHADEEIVKGFPLAEYAAKHWVTHAQFEDVASRMKDGMLTLFDCDKPHFAAWVRIYDIDEPYRTYRKSPSDIPTPLYYSSLCGFSNVVGHIAIKHPEHSNAAGGRHNFPLFAAVFRKHIGVAEILVEHGANIDIRLKAGQTPLHKAIRDVGMVQSLLKNGADVNCRKDDLRTPLHLAAYYVELKVARVLVEHKADVCLQDNEGKTPMHLLLENRLRDDDDIVDLARLLLEHGTDENMRSTNELKRTLLQEEALRGGFKTARLSLERGVNVHAQDKDQNTVLHVAAFYENLKVTQLLLDHGANPNAEDKDGATPLHKVSYGTYSSQKYAVGIARLLLERGADPNAQQKNKYIPLHLAAYNGRLEIVQLLLDHGANPNAEDKDGATPLHKVSYGEYSSQERGVGIARLLLERGVDPNARRKNKDIPLHWAAFQGRLEIVQLLLNHGANPNAEDEDASTPLHKVSSGKYGSREHGVGIARLLLEHGVDIHARTKFHATALHRAAFSGKFDIVQLLLEHGANPNAENMHGEIPLHLVSRGKYDSKEYSVGVVRQLLERDVDVNALDKDRNTPLHTASCLGRLEIARVLLDRGATVGSENDRAQTPLHLVSQGSYWFQDDGPGVTKLLLERGADIDAQDKDYTTPLHLACYRGRLDIARALLDHDANAQAENDEDLVPSTSQVSIPPASKFHCYALFEKIR